MNFQNINRDDPAVKQAIIPQLDELIEFDYSQIEPRLLAYFSAKLGDETLAGVYKRGEDIYRVTAGALLNKKPEDVMKAERQLWGKIVFLSIIYGAGPKKISETHDVPYAEAKEFWLNMHKNLPCIRMISNPPPRQWRSDYEPGAIERVLKRKGYIETIAGRRLAPGQWEEHKMLNKLIQGSAAEIMKRAINRVHRWTQQDKPVSRPVLTVHDSLLWDVHAPERALLLAKVPPLMIDEPMIQEVVPLVVEATICYPSWADKKETV